MISSHNYNCSCMPHQTYTHPLVASRHQSSSQSSSPEDLLVGDEFVGSTILEFYGGLILLMSLHVYGMLGTINCCKSGNHVVSSKLKECFLAGGEQF